MARIVIGSYYEADSLLHRLDPRAKMVLGLVYLVCIFVAPSFVGLALMAVFTAVMVALSKVPLRTVLRSVTPLAFILVFAVLINLFFIREGTIYWQWHFLSMSSVGIYRAIFYPLRMALILIGMSLLTLTTSPIDITDAFHSLLRPLRRIGVPAHEISMMLGIALRFLPVFFDEFGKIRKAQESRGASFEEGNVFKRATALIPLLVPLFVSAFRHADNLAQAMESRCYHGGEGRSRMNVMHVQRRDYVAAFVCMVVLAAAIIMRVLL